MRRIRLSKRSIQPKPHFLSLTAILLTIAVVAGIGLKIHHTSHAASQLVLGVNDHPIWLSASQDTQWNYIVNSGAKSVRIDAAWDVLDGGSKGTYSSFRLGLIDAFVNRASAAGIDIDMVVTNAPQWANGSTDPHVPPTNNADFADYLQFLMQRYAGKVHAYEIWNEPNGGWAWTNPDAVRYAGLLKVAYTRAKSIDPTVTILAPSLSGPDQATWLDAAYAAGIKDYFDVFSMHGYWFNLNGSQVYPYYDAAAPAKSIFGAFTTNILPVMNKYGDGAKRVWWTETGIATQGAITTESDQTNKVDEAITDFKNRVIPTMDRLYWYDITDSVGTGSEQNYGLVNLTGSSATVPAPGDFVPKPAYSHFQAQAATISGGSTATVPTAPQAVHTTTADSQVTLTWTAPSSDGGSAITGYRVTRETGDSVRPGSWTGTVSASTLSQGFTLLQDGTSYTFSVNAINAIGEGSKVTVQATPLAVPVIGDVNSDGKVNIFDLSTLLSKWGTSDAASDLNHDGTVNIFDLSTLLSHWTG